MERERLAGRERYAAAEIPGKYIAYLISKQLQTMHGACSTARSRATQGH